MFSCRDITQRICRHLEACDVFNLVKVNKKAHEMVTSLLDRTTMGCREFKGDIVFTVTTIPLLDIRELVPAGVTKRGETYSISRVLRIRELRAEILHIIPQSPTYNRPMTLPQKYVYIVDDRVKHFICANTTNGVCRAYTPIIAPSVHEYLNDVGTGSIISEFNWGLMRAMRVRGVGAQMSLCTTTTASHAIAPVLTSEEFLRFIISFEQ